MLQSAKPQKKGEVNMIRQFIAVFASIILVLAAFATANGKENALLVDKLLAMVGINTITAQDVEVEKKILKLAEDSLLYPGQESTLTNKMVFKELLVQDLLYQSAIKIGLDQVDEDSIKFSMKAFANRFDNEDDHLLFLISLELSDPKFDKRMGGSTEWVHYTPISKRFRKMFVAKGFIDKKIRLQVRLTLQARFKEEKAKLAAENPGLDDDALKIILEQKMIQEGLKIWLKDIKERTTITILVKDYIDVLQ